MSMEDIFKVLINTRQQGSNPQTGADPMADLIGGLLGGNAAPQQQSAPEQPGLGGMMDLLETVMSGQANTGTANDPIMALLSPFIAPLAKKANIPPEIATIVITFVVHKLLAHHPTSGRDSNSFDLDQAMTELNTGGISSNLLQSSGMVREISKRTGMDEATSEQSLQLAFALVGKTVTKLAAKKPSSSLSKPQGKAGGKSVSKAGIKSTGIKRKTK